MAKHEKPFSVKIPEDATKGLNFKVECKDCKSVIDVTKQTTTFNVLHKTKSGQAILLTYFDCPVCKARHYVQIDDRHTSELKKSVLQQATRMFAKKHKGKAVPESQRIRFNKQKDKLTMLRNELMKKYEGETVTNTITGEEVELHFTIC